MKKIAFFVLPLFLFLNSGAQTTADDYFKLGIEKDSLQDYPGAIIAFTKAIELNPNNPVFYFLLRYNDRLHSPYGTSGVYHRCSMFHPLSSIPNG